MPIPQQMIDEAREVTGALQPGGEGFIRLQRLLAQVEDQNLHEREREIPHLPHAIQLVLDAANAHADEIVRRQHDDATIHESERIQTAVALFARDWTPQEQRETGIDDSGEPSTPWLLLVGDPVEGFTLVGPFPDEEDAKCHAGKWDNGDWWPIPVTHPALGPFETPLLPPDAELREMVLDALADDTSNDEKHAALTVLAKHCQIVIQPYAHLHGAWVQTADKVRFEVGTTSRKGGEPIASSKPVGGESAYWGYLRELSVIGADGKLTPALEYYA